MASTSVQPLARQLGFAATDRVAIVHADDIGMCHAANVGAFDALANGVVSCGSIMVPCPWFREAADLARANPHLDLGVHLTLNAEWPQLPLGPRRRSRPRAVAARRAGLPAAHAARGAARGEARTRRDRAARADRDGARGGDRRHPPRLAHGHGAARSVRGRSTRSSRRSTGCRCSRRIPIPPCWSARASARSSR